MGSSFLRGYRAAFEVRAPASLHRRLERIPADFRGFAYEGASLAIALLDALLRRREPWLPAFLGGKGARHRYLIHVGAGWALARAPLRPSTLQKRLDPLLSWLVFDGWGFHEGYFHASRRLWRFRRPRRLGGGYRARAFDQGLGRSLWFVEGGSALHIAAAIDRFPEERRSDLWSGVGLACVYAGGVDASGVAALREEAGPWRPFLAQGAAFAAKARTAADSVTAATDMACRVLCGRTAFEAAALTDRTREGLLPEGAYPSFETWRRRIQANFREEMEPRCPQAAPAYAAP